MAALPVGATFGSLVHAVLEHADPAAADLRAELLRHIVEQLVWWPVDLDPRSSPTRWWRCATARSARWSATARCVRCLPDRLRELDFELPLAGGDLVADPDRRTSRRPGPAAATAPARG